MTLAGWIMIAMPVALPAHTKDLVEGAEIDGFNPHSVGQSLQYLADTGRLVKVGPALYRRPTKHEANQWNSTKSYRST